MAEILLDPKEPPLINNAEEEEFYFNRLMDLVRIYKNYLIKTSEHDLDDDGGDRWRTEQANGEDFEDHDGTSGVLNFEADPSRKDWYDDPKYEKFIYIHDAKEIFKKIIELEKQGIDIKNNVEIEIIDNGEILANYVLPFYKVIIVEAFYAVISTSLEEDIKLKLDVKVYPQLKIPGVFDTIIKYIDYRFIYSSESMKKEVPMFNIPEELKQPVCELAVSFET